LWRFDEAGFFPHGTEDQPRQTDQQVLISKQPSTVNDPSALIFTCGSHVSASGLDAYQRVSILFDGRNPDELTQARSTWKELTQAGLTAKYWSQETGKWEMKASSDAR
ncbi:MAG: DNA polymerase III subunit chi, partial [Pseudomonadota bacterium]